MLVCTCKLNGKLIIKLKDKTQVWKNYIGKFEFLLQLNFCLKTENNSISVICMLFAMHLAFNKTLMLLY